MGVVIGETAEIGENVTIYQGVTLGGTGFATGKRHPTVEDNVTIGSGAKLLGPITIGHGAKIGANAVVIHDVPPNSTVVGNPGHPVRVEGRRPEGPDADWVHLPDPIADAIKVLSRRIAELERELAAPRRPPRTRRRPTSCRCATSAARTPPVASFCHTVASRAARGGLPVAVRGGQGPAVDRAACRPTRCSATAARPRARRSGRCLTVSGQQLDLELEITRYEPPRLAETRFSTNGLDVVTTYALRESAAGRS